MLKVQWPWRSSCWTRALLGLHVFQLGVDGISVAARQGVMDASPAACMLLHALNAESAWRARPSYADPARYMLRGKDTVDEVHLATAAGECPDYPGGGVYSEDHVITSRKSKLAVRVPLSRLWRQVVHQGGYYTVRLLGCSL